MSPQDSNAPQGSGAVDNADARFDGAPQTGQNRRHLQLLSPALVWLGLRPSAVVAGIHITSDSITLVVVKDRPLRLVAIGRAPVLHDAVVGNEIRLMAPVVAALEKLVRDLRLERGVITTAAVEPVANSFTIWDEEQEVPTYNVFSATHERIRTVADLAGLTPSRVDLVPAALARLGRAIGTPTIAARAPTGWTVTTNNGFTDAKRSDHGSPTGQPLSHLGGIHVPRRLAGLVDPAGDAVAVGAAIAGFGHQPLIATQAVSSPLGPDWVVQQISSKADNKADGGSADRSTTSHEGANS